MHTEGVHFLCAWTALVGGGLSQEKATSLSNWSGGASSSMRHCNTVAGMDVTPKGRAGVGFLVLARLDRTFRAHSH